MTYLPFPSLYMYKGLSMVFDIVLAAAVGWMVWRLGQRRSKPAAGLPYAPVFLLPTTPPHPGRPGADALGPPPAGRAPPPRRKQTPAAETQSQVIPPHSDSTGCGPLFPP